MLTVILRSQTRRFEFSSKIVHVLSSALMAMPVVNSRSCPLTWKKEIKKWFRS